MRKAWLVLALLASFGSLQACSSGDEKGDVDVFNENAFTDGNSARNGDSGYIEGTQEDLSINIGDRVLFGYDSALLGADAQQTLTKQAAWLARYPNLVITIEGHCDERGTREYNIALGERRAVSVRNYLISSGVSGDRITVISYGKERPIALGSNEEAWRQNRRAVTVVN